MDASLEAFLSFDALSFFIIFDGNEQSAQLANKTFKITYELTNKKGKQATFDQIVIMQSP